MPPDERPFSVPPDLIARISEGVERLTRVAPHLAARVPPRRAPLGVPRVLPGLTRLTPRALASNLPPCAPAALSPRIPPVGGRPGAFTVRGPDGADWPVDPDDSAALRALAARLLEPR